MVRSAMAIHFNKFNSLMSTDKWKIFSNILKMQKRLKLAIKLIFLCCFLWLSWNSLRSWLKGNVSYSLGYSKEDKLLFPSVTLCPYQDLNPLMNIKIGELRSHLNLSANKVEGFAILRTIQKSNLSQILNKYSFSREESFPINGLLMQGVTPLTPPLTYVQQHGLNCVFWLKYKRRKRQIW